ncbi:MAG TPA: ATP-binding cassette domain-containing protein [Chitinispirillaceae bacterium]|nr:ATP-binding cassette domain-containing protein [Chitinispirillaceae bacterium]
MNIEFDHLCFSRGNRLILNNISFHVNSSENIAILGGSGEGKTTILRLLMRLLKPDCGRILIDGEDISDKTEEQLRPIRRKFTIVFQDGALFDSLTVKENVAFYMREYTRMNEDEIEINVRKLLGFVGVEQAIDLMPEELSGGMQRRVAIARALAVQKPLMFLYDEPTSDLDPLSAARIRELILNLSNAERGFIVVTHEILDALKLAHRFMFLKGGSILFDGNKEDFLRTDLKELRTFLGDWNEEIRK